MMLEKSKPPQKNLKKNKIQKKKNIYIKKKEQN